MRKSIFTDSERFLFLLQGDDGKKGKKKKSADLIELPIDAELPGNTDADLQRYRDEEVSDWTFFNSNQKELRSSLYS